jgi:uncharacterized membrane protein YbaN (DUF454 family)
VALGVLGIFLPLLPTTPFLLLAAACYGASSETAYRRLLSTPLLGRHIADYRAGRGVPLRAKILAMAMLWISLGYAVAYTAAPAFGKLALLLIGAGVSWYLLRLPSAGNLDTQAELARETA